VRPGVLTYKNETKRELKVLVLMAVLLPVFFLIDLRIGSYPISFSDLLKAIFSPSTLDNQVVLIVNQYRIPKAFTAILAGAALSVSGLQMQTVFRNPLAGPYILGVSSGASLGVALVVLGTGGFIGWESVSILSSWGIVAAAWLGSALVLMLIIAISARIREIMTILIMGILISSAISALVNILQYYSNEATLKSFVIWTMGSLGSVTNPQLSVLIPSVLVGIAIAFLCSKFLDAFLLGENYAQSLGMNIRFARTMVFFSTAILAGSITAFCGPIGFIGIAVPHIARIMLQSAKHSLLIPATILIGAIIMLLSDILSQLPGSQRILPINSVTALLGIPIVIWIIIRNKSSVNF
jgi:iron complex transport system permease protein